jgi:phospholipase C
MSNYGGAAHLSGAALALMLALSGAAAARDGDDVATATPIKHLVVIFQENNSFDHYFATYPKALNPSGEPEFYATDDTPTINGLSPELIANNPNSTKPFRLDRNQAVLNCDNNNGYGAEQIAFDHGLMDKFPEATSSPATPAAGDATACPNGIVMGYYDGNTVTALWNYAQHFAMSDNFYDTEFGVTAMGHFNLIAGQTHQSNIVNLLKTGASTFVVRNGSVIANLDAGPDTCRAAPVKGQPVASVTMTGPNVGDLINGFNAARPTRRDITWGWFYGNFDLVPGPTGAPQCDPAYDDHHVPFQYYVSTANPNHALPLSAQAVGHSVDPRSGKLDPANHQYSLTTFWKAAQAGNLPAVSFLKAPEPDNGHPQTSDPLSEQSFLVATINRLQQLPEWRDMAIVITYDDSDGWYDHVMGPIVNQSNDPLLDSICGGTQVSLPAGAFNDRCGYGMRMPMLVISPFAKRNYVDHAVTDTSSILRFIEDNWLGGMRIDDVTRPAPMAGQKSFDKIAGSIQGMFDFDVHPNLSPLVLDGTTGEVIRDRDRF